MTTLDLHRLRAKLLRPIYPEGFVLNYTAILAKCICMFVRVEKCLSYRLCALWGLEAIAFTMLALLKAISTKAFLQVSFSNIWRFVLIFKNIVVFASNKANYSAAEMCSLLMKSVLELLYLIFLMYTRKNRYNLYSVTQGYRLF